MKRLLTLPTWIIAKMLMPFLPINHPWKNEKITLKDWALNSTNLNDCYSLVFWLIPILLFLIV